jgi:hypothetical protein
MTITSTQPEAIAVVKKPHPGGRPTVIDEVVLRKLDEAFSIGATDNEACLYADISPRALYSYQDKHPEFKQRKDLLKEKPILKARTTVINSLNDPEIAFRYLERKRKDEFAPNFKGEIAHSLEDDISKLTDDELKDRARKISARLTENRERAEQAQG